MGRQVSFLSFVHEKYPSSSSHSVIVMLSPVQKIGGEMQCISIYTGTEKPKLTGQVHSALIIITKLSLVVTLPIQRAPRWIQNPHVWCTTWLNIKAAFNRLLLYLEALRGRSSYHSFQHPPDHRISGRC